MEMLRQHLELLRSLFSTVFLVDRVNGLFVGFSGWYRYGSIYRRMLHYWPQLFWALLPSVFSYRRVRRILEILRYSHSGGGLNFPDAELLSIAVYPGFRGQGHAQTLYSQLREHFRLRGVPAFKIVVGAALAPAHQFYQRMGASAVSHIAVHQGEASTVYVQTLSTFKAKS